MTRRQMIAAMLVAAAACGPAAEASSSTGSPNARPTARTEVIHLHRSGLAVTVPVLDAHAGGSPKRAQTHAAATRSAPPGDLHRGVGIAAAVTAALVITAAGVWALLRSSRMRWPRLDESDHGRITVRDA